MRLIDLKHHLTGFRSIKEIYKQLVLLELEKQRTDNNIALQQFFSIYTREELLEALDSIQYNGRGFLEVSEHTRNNQILRYLEYGGESAKPTHILSKAKLALDKYFNTEDR